MKWWAFSEEQLEAALQKYLAMAATQTGKSLMEKSAEEVRHFLNSELVLQLKMRGDK